MKKKALLSSFGRKTSGGSAAQRRWGLARLAVKVAQAVWPECSAYRQDQRPMLPGATVVALRIA